MLLYVILLRSIYTEKRSFLGYNFQIFDVDISKLSDTTDVKVIFTFDCEQGAEEIRDMKPDYFGIKGEVFVNFYKDKRTVIEVSPSSDYNCNPEFKVFYE